MVSFAEIALMSAQLDFFVGAYALRALVFSRPAQCQVYDAMHSHAHDCFYILILTET